MERKPTYDNFLIKVGQLEHDLSREHEGVPRLYKFIENTNRLPYAFVICQIVTGENNFPADFKFIAANQIFENISGLKNSDINSKSVIEILPVIKDQKFDWISVMGHVAIFGAKALFQIYMENLNSWFIVSAFCPDHNFFVLAFDNITEMKEQEKETMKSQTN